jgi:two-component system, OmpR family, sensor kinase ParS
MRKLFLKLWLLILLTLFISYQLQITVHEKWRVDSRPLMGSDERARRMMVLVEEVLEKYPESEWGVQVERLKSRVGSPEIWLGITNLIDLRQLEMEPRLTRDNIKKIVAGEYQSVVFADSKGFDIFQRLKKSQSVLVLSGPTELRWPVLVLGIFNPTHVSWFIESSILALGIFLWVRLFRNDLVALETGAMRVGSGHFNTHIQMKHYSALFPLADAFNQMTTRVSKLISSHKQLTNSVSHEIRTPIMRLRFRHLLAMEEDTLAGKNRELIEMESAIDQLDDLSTELLEYAKLDRGEPNFVASIIDVAPWLAELVHDAKEATDMNARNITFVTETNATHVEGDYRYLTRAAANLIRNAVRYTKSQIVITVAKVDDQYVLTVDDDGEGVPITERERLFEPFTRLDRSRDRATGGFGIGLAIVKQVAELHRGVATIGAATIGGAHFKIVWPVESTATK